MDKHIHSLLTAIGTTNQQISVVGSMNADYTVFTQRLPLPGETVEGGQLVILPGGKSGNQAASAARIGAHVQLIGAVGTDTNADFLLNHLQDAGVDTSAIEHVEGASGTTVITVDEQGENTIVYSPGSNGSITPEFVRAHTEIIANSAVLGLCLESPMDSVIEAAQIAHENNTLVLVNNSPFHENIPEALRQVCDILLVNEHEMCQMLGIAEPSDDDWEHFDWNQAIEALRAAHINRAVVTLGSKGSVVIENGTYKAIQPVKVQAVDTTGCGDAFMGTILAGLAEGYSLEESAQCASYVAGFAATQHGAQASYGTVEQINAYFA